jgi:RNA polymerase sigma-70 factor (ECF subfamily)
MRETFPPGALSPAAFADLLARLQWPLYSFLRGMVADDEQARDITQDVFCDAWRAVKRAAAPFSADGDEDGVRRWLFHTAYCRAVSTLRRRRLIRWESLDVPALADDDDTLIAMPFEDQVAEGEAMRAALATLGAEDVACLLLNVLQGFTSAEIAQIVGIMPEAAKKRLSRAKQRLRAAYLVQNPAPGKAVSS